MRAGKPLKSSPGPQNTHAGRGSPAMLLISAPSLQKVPSMESSPPHAFLRGGSEEKAFRGATVSVNNFPKQGAPAEIRLPAQGEKVARYLLPNPAPLGAADTAQVVPPSQHGMGASKPFHYHPEPAGHQPRGHLTIGIKFHRCAMEPLLPPVPAPQAQEQGSQDRMDRVLEIGNQLHGQQGQSSPAPSAQEARNGNPFLRKGRKQLSRIPPVGGNLSIAALLPADGAGRSDEGGKINPTGKKRFLVFPNRLTCVRIGKLNRSAALPTRGRSSVATPLGLLPCGSWLFFQGQFLTSLFPLPLYHRSENPVNTSPPTPKLYRGR
jgi:hypothetical protein